MRKTGPSNLDENGGNANEENDYTWILPGSLRSLLRSMSSLK